MTEQSPNIEPLKDKTILVVASRPEMAVDYLNLLKQCNANVIISKHSLDDDVSASRIPGEAKICKAAAVLIHNPHAIDNPQERERTKVVAAKLKENRIALVVVDACISTKPIQLRRHRHGDQRCMITELLRGYGAVGLGCKTSAFEVVNAIADSIANKGRPAGGQAR